MAALILRCLVTWLSLMLFMIFVLLKLDKLITWNWFLIFIPMWIYDLIVILYWGLKIGLRHRNTDSRERNSAQNIWRIVSGCLKLFFELLLCIYLQYDYNLKLFYVFIPFWSLLLGLVVEAGILAFH
ncbi:TMEM60 [Bugula neritina]|uniref:TMEM60 n=1 Tax=Bugula neritina TaxID=10212 RepID=A0A7J7KI13_BUGNE|nr:TMEM60 [Bugula neritina]